MKIMQVPLQSEKEDVNLMWHKSVKFANCIVQDEYMLPIKFFWQNDKVDNLELYIKPA